jgi:hypothetical protein
VFAVSSGNVNIGATTNTFNPKLGVTSTAAFPLAVITSQVAGAAFNKSTDGAGNHILFTSNNSSNYGVIGVNNANGTSAGDQFQLGYVSSAGAPATGVLLWGRAATCVGLNIAPATSGTGITFPTSQNASSDANTLDDYEEGTWSPTVFIGATEVTSYHFQNGSYTKVGRIVHANCWVRVNNKGAATGLVTIRGLPFTIAGGNSSYTAGSIGYQDEMLSSSAPMYCFGSINTATVTLAYATATSLADVTQANLNNGQFMMQISYPAAN